MPARLAILASTVALVTAATAQPQGVVLWSYPCDEGVYSTAAIEDLDGDSTPEVVAAINYINSSGEPRKVYCMSGASGDTVWINRTAYGVWGNRSLDISPDLSGDGIEDVLLGTAAGYTTPGRSVIAIDGLSGDTLWRYTRYEQWGWVYSVRPFPDIDGDSCPDVVGVAGTSTGYTGAAVLVSGRTGDEIWFFRLPSDAAECAAPFVDVNHDSVPEVVIGAGGNFVNDTVYCLSGANGLPVWKQKTGGSNSDVRRITDVNSSGMDDVVTGGWSDSVYCLEGNTGAFIWAAEIGHTVMELAPVRDLNADDVDDVAVASWDSNVHVLSGADGSVLWLGWVGADAWSVDTVADVSGDGLPEIISGSVNGRSVRLFDGSTGQTIWYYDFTERVYDVTGIPDVNADGHADVAVGLQDQGNLPDHLYCISGMPGSGIQAEPTAAAFRLLSAGFGGRLALTLETGTRYRLSIVDAAGRLRRRLTGVTTADRTDIELADLPPGTWFCRLLASDGRAATAKLTVPPGLTR